MHLKRLEILGFKSFAQKTVLDFPAGISVVVGPNGSGKSNIIDAIRWLLGEREAKNIRGAKAEDLIFSGTPLRSRTSMAQVTIIFDNTSRFFPVDYSEISIRRQVTRDGISQYFLNDVEIRLKDIIDFFAKVRLGTKGLAIVNQGESDIFVRANPKERRTMIEEILGLRQYQLKKHEAERKLESTKFNLEKTDAMINELMPHLRLLRRQAAKYGRQAEVEKELRDLENNYFSVKLKIIQEDFKALEPKIIDIGAKIKDKLKDLKSAQADLKKVEDSAPKGDRGFEDFKKNQTALLGRRATLQKELGRLEGQLEFLLAQPKTDIPAAQAIKLLSELKLEISTITAGGDIEKMRGSLRGLLEKIDRLLDSGGKEKESRSKELEKSKERLLAELFGLDKTLEVLNESELKLNTELKNFNETFKKVFEQVEAKKDEISRLENQKNQLLFDKERIEIRKQELANLAAQASRKLSEFEGVAGGELGNLAGADLSAVALAEAEKKMFKLRAELAGIGELDPALIKEAQEIEARYNFLSTQVEDLNKAVKDLGVLIEDLDNKLHTEFTKSLHAINEQLNHYFRLMFGGGHAKLRLEKIEIKKEEISSEEVNLENAGTEEGGSDEDAEHKVDHGGIEIDVSIPKKKISGLDMLSGGERSLVSIAALFALISVSPPPFLVLDEVDAALDERNTRRFAEMISEFSQKTQFLLVSHNRATMEAADILYGVTMGEDGTSKVLSLKLESAEAVRQ